MEKASGARNDRQERKRVMALAQSRQIDAILVAELSRWGRSTQDLVQTLDDLHSWNVSVLAARLFAPELFLRSAMSGPEHAQHTTRTEEALFDHFIGAVEQRR